MDTQLHATPLTERDRTVTFRVRSLPAIARLGTWVTDERRRAVDGLRLTLTAQQVLEHRMGGSCDLLLSSQIAGRVSAILGSGTGARLNLDAGGVLTLHGVEVADVAIDVAQEPDAGPAPAQTTTTVPDISTESAA